MEKNVQLRSNPSKAFKQEHILALVLSFTETTSLKGWRHVSRMWKNVSAVEISKRVEILLQIMSCAEPPQISNDPELFEVRVNERILMSPNLRLEYPIMLTSLTNLMNLSSYFPCRNFHADISEFTTSFVQSHLTQIYPHLKSLNLFIRVYGTRAELDTEIADIMKCLENLLCEKAVQLENFGIMLYGNFGRKIFNLALSNWDLNPKNEFSQKKLCLRNLKNFFVGNVFSIKAFRDIMDGAINLASLQLVPRISLFDYHFTNYLEYFMENQNLHKVSVISHLNFYINNENIPGFEKFLNHPIVFERLKLKHLHLVDLDNFECTPILHNFHSRVGRLIELLLLSSSQTLRNFIIVPLEHFCGIQIPKLPKLDSIGFFDLSCDAHSSKLTTRIFPIGFCAKQSFPVLKTVTVGLVTAGEERLFRKLCVSFDEPVESVEKFEIENGSCLLPSARARVNTVSNVFPNAVISLP